MKQTELTMKAIMKTSILRSPLILFFLGILPLSALSQTAKVWTKIDNYEDLRIEPKSGQILNSTNREISAMFGQLEISSVEKAFPASRSAELSKVYEITCNCDENDLLTAIASKSIYFKNPEIIQEPIALYETNDYDVIFSNDYALNLINAKNAWSITQGDSSIIIAITDANYYLNHEELIGKYNHVSTNNSSNYNHGTAVAITASGNTDNAVGKSSVGFNSMLQLRAMNFNEVLEASYAGAQVVNMSWASGCSYSSYTQQLIDEAYANGTILVASAGNGSTCGGPENLVYPASYNHVISVSSVGPWDNHERYIGNPSSTHQHNALVDICAPGYDVAISTAPGVYTTGNGTSFAAPYVSGTIALMLAVNPCLSAEEVEIILKGTAVNIEETNPTYIGQLGSGRIDAGAAVLMASTYNTISINGQKTVECSSMEQGIVLDLSAVASPYTISWNTEDTSATLNNIEPGEYSVRVRDVNGCIGYYSTTIDTLVPMNIIADIYPVTCNGDNNGHIELTVHGGHAGYNYYWSTGATTTNLYNLSAGIYSISILDEKGCSLIEEFELLEPNVLSASITKQDVQFNFSGSIDLNVTGGTEPYEFSWSHGPITEDLENLEEGFYEVLITDAKGCLASANTLINNVNVIVTTENELSDKYEIENSSDNNISDESSPEDHNGTDLLGVYPNPANDYAKVIWDGMIVSKVYLYDFTGKLIRTYDIQPSVNSIELSGISRGDYLLKLHTDDGIQAIKKVSFL